MKITRYFLIFCSAVWAFALYASAPSAPSDADRRKADFLFMEAATAEAEGRIDDRIMLLRRAAALCPGDPFITGALAEEVLSNQALRDEALYKEMTRPVIDRFQAEPTIYINGQSALQAARYIGDSDLEVRILETMHENLPKNQDVTVSLSDAYISRWLRDMTDTVSYTKGMEILERLVSAAPDNLMFNARMVRPLLAKSDTAAVQQRLVALQTAAPADVNVAIFTAQIYSMFGKDSLVENAFRRGREIDAQNGQLLMAMAEYYRQKGDSAAYDNEVFAALSAPDLEFDVKLPLLKDYVVALYSDTIQQPRINSLFELMQQTNPGEEELHTLYASYLMATQRNADAIDQLNVAIGLKPSDQPLYTQLVRLYLVEGNPEKAIDTGRKGVEMFPEDLMLAIFTSYGLSEADSIPQAIELMESFNPDVLNETGKGELYSRLGDLYHLNGEEEKTFEAYEKSIIYNPENYMAMNNLAYFYAEADTLLSRAEMYATLAVGAQADNPTYLDTYAWIFFKQNRYKEAREKIDEALRLLAVPEEVRAIVGETGEVTEELTEQPSAEIYDHAGDIYFFLRDPRNALVFWEEALKLAPENEKIRAKVERKAYVPDL